MLAQLVPNMWALRLTMFPSLVLGFPSRELTTTKQHLTQTLKDFGLQNQNSWNLLLYQPTWQLCYITHVFLWLLSLSCCLEDMVQQPWAKHPDGSKCQPVALADTELMCFTVVLGGDVWCQLGLRAWLANQSPNQVDSSQVAINSRQHTQ